MATSKATGKGGAKEAVSMSVDMSLKRASGEGCEDEEETTVSTDPGSIVSQQIDNRGYPPNDLAALMALMQESRAENRAYQEQTRQRQEETDKSDFEAQSEIRKVVQTVRTEVTKELRVQTTKI